LILLAKAALLCAWQTPQDDSSSCRRASSVGARGSQCNALRIADFRGRTKGISWLRAYQTMAGSRIIL
jgi:hypothetical protein